MFDLFNLALLVFINKVRMGISNKPCVPVIRDALWSSPPPGPFLQEGAGAGPAVDTGPTVCGPSPPCGRYRARWGPRSGQGRWSCRHGRHGASSLWLVAGRASVPCLVFGRTILITLGLPRRLSGKESAFNAGDMGSIHGSGRCSGG